jgi:Fe-S-cluster containining protein
VKLDRFGEPAFATATVVDGLYRALRGTCVFYTGTGCGIYEARPLECATYICTNAPEDNLTHEAIGRRWMDDA